MTRFPSVVVAAVASMLVSCTTPPAIEKHGGGTKVDAIEVCRPQGERAYLSRLVCPDGTAADPGRRSNVGFRNSLPNGGPELTVDPFAKLPAGVGDWHIVDAYEVACGATKHRVYLDMYHCDVAPPDLAPEGLTLRR